MHKFKLRGITTKAGLTMWYAWYKRDWLGFLDGFITSGGKTLWWAPLTPCKKHITRVDSLGGQSAEEVKALTAIDGEALPIADNREDAERLCREYARGIDADRKAKEDLEVVYDTGPVYFEIKGGMS